MMIVLAWILLVTPTSTYQSDFFRTFKCINDECQRTKKPISSLDRIRLNDEHSTLSACRLVCGQFRGLWPTPTGSTSFGTNYTEIQLMNVFMDLDNIPSSTKTLVTKFRDNFMHNLGLTCGECDEGQAGVTIRLGNISENLELNYDTIEAYNMSVRTNSRVEVVITAQTVYGVRHALETLSQLCAVVQSSSNAKRLVIINQADIEDKPKFVHRGLLIDTARNFLSVSTILKTIDALAATKMNVLHWHATDSQSFPLFIESRPLMSWYGAYEPGQIYTAENVKRIVKHGKERGVKVILELDSPSHAGAGWDWGEALGLGKLAVCVNKEPWRDFCVQPPCGQLNPTNNQTLVVLKDIYHDMLSILGSDGIIHLGGDEVHMNCWNSSEEIIRAMADRGMGRSTEDFLRLWGEFHAKQLAILDELKPGRRDSALIWSSALTAPEIIERHVSKSRFIIQTWVESDSLIPEHLLRLGYRLIMSTKDAWYLDHGFWGKTVYHSWRDAYNNRIPRVKGVLGGEACMWGEYVNEGGFDSRVWPRTAAVGERLWGDSDTLTTVDVAPRLEAHRERLWSRQIEADALAPAWCAQHTNKCV